MTTDTVTPQVPGQIPWDTAFKRFFSHAILVKSLLQSFLEPDLVEKLDFDTLEACETNFVTDDIARSLVIRSGRSSYYTVAGCSAM